MSPLAIYEVFGQPRHGEPHRHAGSLLADSPQMAAVLAQELFCRRREFTQIWVVPRDAVTVAPADAGQPGPATPREYRMGEGYRDTVRKWREIRGRGQ